MKWSSGALACLCLASLVLTDCATARGPSGAAAQPSLAAVKLGAGQRLQVLATTGIVGDLALNVGGDLIELRTLLPVGTDPHSYTATPRDLKAIGQAHVILANGAGLEEFLTPLLQSAAGKAPVVDCSHGIALRAFTSHGAGSSGAAKGEHDGVDPHTWMAPGNAIVQTQNIVLALGALDPLHAAQYQANAEEFKSELEELDRWILAQIETIPPAQRKLATDHESFGYYAERYGLEEVGAVVPNVSTAAEPSAKELAAFEDAIRGQGIQAIFVDAVVSPTLSERVATDTGVRLVRVYSGSLGPQGSGAETYLGYMRYNTTAIVEALR